MPKKPTITVALKIILDDEPTPEYLAMWRRLLTTDPPPAPESPSPLPRPAERDEGEVVA
jgi:hypothetical protein